jgi:hypothetical protein
LLVVTVERVKWWKSSLSPWWPAYVILHLILSTVTVTVTVLLTTLCIYVHTLPFPPSIIINIPNFTNHHYNTLIYSAPHPLHSIQTNGWWCSPRHTPLRLCPAHRKQHLPRRTRLRHGGQSLSPFTATANANMTANCMLTTSFHLHYPGLCKAVHLRKLLSSSSGSPQIALTIYCFTHTLGHSLRGHNQVYRPPARGNGCFRTGLLG